LVKFEEGETRFLQKFALEVQCFLMIIIPFNHAIILVWVVSMGSGLKKPVLITNYLQLWDVLNLYILFSPFFLKILLTLLPFPYLCVD